MGIFSMPARKPYLLKTLRAFEGEEAAFFGDAVGVAREGGVEAKTPFYTRKIFQKPKKYAPKSTFCDKESPSIPHS